MALPETSNSLLPISLFLTLSRFPVWIFPGTGISEIGNKYLCQSLFKGRIKASRQTLWGENLMPEIHADFPFPLPIPSSPSLSFPFHFYPFPLPLSLCALCRYYRKVIRYPRVRTSSIRPIGQVWGFLFFSILFYWGCISAFSNPRGKGWGREAVRESAAHT